MLEAAPPLTGTAMTTLVVAIRIVSVLFLAVNVVLAARPVTVSKAPLGCLVQQGRVPPGEATATQGLAMQVSCAGAQQYLDSVSIRHMPERQHAAAADTRQHLSTAYALLVSGCHSSRSEA